MFTFTNLTVILIDYIFMFQGLSCTRDIKQNCSFEDIPVQPDFDEYRVKTILFYYYYYFIYCFMMMLVFTDLF